MASDIMKVVGTCRLATDPRVNDAGNFMRLRVAFNSRVRTDDGWEDKGNFITAVMFGDRVGTLSGFLSKGMKVTIEGDLEMDTWEDGDGAERTEIRIVVRELVLPDRPRDDDAPRRSSGGRGGRDEGGWR